MDALEPPEEIILRTFSSAILKNGYLVQLLTIGATMDNLKSLSTDIFPGLDFILYNQVTPLLCIDKNLLTAKASKIGLEFPIGMLEEPPLEENIEHASD